MGTGDSGGPGVIGRVREWLPRGNTLDADTFHQRHLFICWVLGLHLPALFAFGLVQGYDLADVSLEMLTPTACLVLARAVRNRRAASFFSTAGLVFCSSVLVHLSGGMIESHFHFFILIGIIALYQDWVPFAWNAVFTTLSHGLASGMSPDSMFNHYAGQNKPWLWAAIHGIAVLAGCVGVVVFWKSTETVQLRNSRLLAELGAAEIAAAQAESRQRQTMSDLLINLARRNQSLLNRQLALIAELEQREREPEALSELFQLDHLATRIRRNAESLLVLSGDDPPRLWGRPMPLSEVVRAAAAEVEDYGRVDVLVNDHIEVAGRAVADLAHLLAELIENATTFSPPGSEVRVRSHVSPSSWSACVVSIEDTGIGMSDADLAAANQMLVEPREVDMRRSTLGFHVVSRLAKRYGIDVKVASTPGGGLTALVTLPNELVAETTGSPAPAPAARPPIAAALGPPPVPLPAAPAPAGLPAAEAPPTAPPPAPPVIPPVPAAPAANGTLPPLTPRRPVAPVAASLSGPPVAPAAPAAAAPSPGPVTPSDVGAPAAFRSPAPPAAEAPAPVAPSGERPQGAIWPSTLGSSDALPVATPPAALAPMPPPEPAPPPPPARSGDALDPGVAPTPPLLARGGNLFERSLPTSPAARPRVDPFGPGRDDTPVPSLTRPFVPPPPVLPVDDDDDLLPRLDAASAPASVEATPGHEAKAEVGGDVENEDEDDGAAAAATEVARADEAPEPDAEADERDAEAEAEVADRAAETDGAEGTEPARTTDAGDTEAGEADEAEVEVEKAEMAVGDPDGDVDLAPGTDREVAAARLGEANGRDPEGPRDALDTGTLAIIQDLEDADAGDGAGPADEPAAPVAPVAPAAAVTNGAAPNGTADEPPRTADGLVRRVPGAGLAPALRRAPGQTVPGDSRDPSTTDQRPADTLDRQAVRSMLSQFQASQRAGRAIADSPVDLRPPEEDT